VNAGGSKLLANEPNDTHVARKPENLPAMAFARGGGTMNVQRASVLSTILNDRPEDLLQRWLQLQISEDRFRPDLINETQLRDQSRDFFGLLRVAVKDGSTLDINAMQWDDVRAFLAELSRSRAHQGFSPSETATFVFSLKQPLLAELRRQVGNDIDAFEADAWALSLLIDKLGLYTTEIHQKSREEVIVRQQQELLELSTPVVQLWEGVLALPLIGTLDSARTQVVMENLLQRVVDTGATMAIIDITGVPMVDTLVAQHLLKTIAAARLMGADCIVSGIRPQIAQTIVHLGVQLDVITKATMADAFAVALERLGMAIQQNPRRS
jgi:rsbT co-antagonist protein RsbR